MRNLGTLLPPGRHWEFSMTKKEDKILAELKKELVEFKKNNAENREINELLNEQVLEYQQMIKSFNKKIPDGMFI